jgi:hypothetical protein
MPFSPAAFLSQYLRTQASQLLPAAGCPAHSWFSNEWESDHRVDCRRLKPARDSINQPTQDSATHPNSRKGGANRGPRFAPSWANPISTPSGFAAFAIPEGSQPGPCGFPQRAANPG